MNDKMPRTPFSTALSGSAKETEIRLKNIFSGPKKRPPALFLALMFSLCVFCGNLVSCQVAEAEAPDISQQMPDTPDQAEQPKPKDPEPDTTQPDDAAAPTPRAAYVRVLEDLLYRCTTPDGCTSKDAFDDMSRNTFALADVDGDGREELVLLTRPDIYAGYQGYILDYDTNTGNVYTQFEGFPSFTFYSSGTMTKNDSHAQRSWTETFWPHSIYRYLPETDSYEFAGHVDAWEKAFASTNFPSEKDTSGAGILYYIEPLRLYTYEERINMAVDQSVYLKWLEQYTDGTQPLELEYLPLTEENIAHLEELL